MKAPEALPAQQPLAAKANDKAAPFDPGRELQERLWQLLLTSPSSTAAALGMGAELLPLSLPSGAGSLAAPSGVSATASDASTEADGDRNPQANSGQAELAATAYMLAGFVMRLSLSHDANSFAAALAEPSAFHPDGAPEIAVQTLDQDGNGRASVELAHPELGTIGLEVELIHGAMRVTATADTDSSALVLQQGQAALAERLLRQGVALEALDVVVVRKRQRKPANRSRSRPRPESRKEESRE
jgi:hypothetical protein